MHKKIILFLIISVMNNTAYAQDNIELKIMQSVERQMSLYPKSTLQDLYKHFFQDRFGPGHILSDTSASANYLKKELAKSKRFDGAEYEPTGYLGNFYRVNLSIIKDGKVDFSTFFKAFVRSMEDFKLMPIEEWKIEWKKILNVIALMKLDLPYFKQDCLSIDELLKKGNYVMHHSRIFNDTYELHYRIIEKEIFEKELLPYLNK